MGKVFSQALSEGMIEKYMEMILKLRVMLAQCWYMKDMSDHQAENGLYKMILYKMSTWLEESPGVCSLGSCIADQV